MCRWPLSVVVSVSSDKKVRYATPRMHYHPDHTRRSGLKIICQRTNWRNKQQSDRCKIPSDVVLIGSGTLAGDLGGIILRKQQKWHYILLFQYCFWQASMAACLADMDQWNYCEQIALTYLLKLLN